MKGIVSHAQNFEDVVLWRALGDVERGFYVDIGAYDPVDASVSLAFYERGWRGVHVEPLPKFAQRLRRERPDEEVVEAAVGDRDGEITLWEATNRAGCSTCDRENAEQLAADGIQCRSWTVRCLTTDQLLASYVGRAVHWLKIDVEGAEAAVLRGWSANDVRPWVLVIEATAPNRREPTHEGWEPDLLAKGYRFASFDGLNRFYVADEHQALASRLSVPPNWFDGFTLGDRHPLVAARATELRQCKKERARISTQLEEQRALVAHYCDSLSWRITAPLRFLLRQISQWISRQPSRPPTERATQPARPSRPHRRRRRRLAARLRHRLLQVADHPTVVRLIRPVLLRMPGMRKRLQDRLVRLRSARMTSGAPGPSNPNLSADAARVFRALQCARKVRDSTAGATTDAYPD